MDEGLENESVDPVQEDLPQEDFSEEELPLDSLLVEYNWTGEEVYITKDQYELIVGHLIDVNIQLKLILFMLVILFAWRLFRK